MTDQPMSDDELKVIKARIAERKALDTWDGYDDPEIDLEACIAEIERLRTESEQLKRSVMSVVQGEIRRAEAMDGKPEYPIKEEPALPFDTAWLQLDPFDAAWAIAHAFILYRSTVAPDRREEG